MGNAISCMVKVKFSNLLSEITHNEIVPFCKDMDKKNTERSPVTLIVIGMAILPSIELCFFKIKNGYLISIPCQKVHVRYASSEIFYLKYPHHDLRIVSGVVFLSLHP